MSNINNIILVLLQEDYKERLATVRGQQNFNTPGGGSSSDTSNFYKVGGLRDSVSPDKSVQKLQNQREIETQRKANLNQSSFLDTINSKIQNDLNSQGNLATQVNDPIAQKTLNKINQNRVIQLQTNPNFNVGKENGRIINSPQFDGSSDGNQQQRSSIKDQVQAALTPFNTTPDGNLLDRAGTPNNQSPGTQVGADLTSTPNNIKIQSQNDVQPSQQQSNDPNAVQSPQQSLNNQNTTTEPLQQQSDINSNVQAALDAYNNRNISQPVFSKWMSGLGKGALGTLAGTGGLLALLPGLLFNHKGLQLGGLLGGLGAIQGFGGMKNDWRTANQNNAANFAAYDKYNDLMNKLSPAEAAQVRNLTGNTQPVAQQANPNVNMSALQSKSAFSTI